MVGTPTSTVRSGRQLSLKQKARLARVAFPASVRGEVNCPFPPPGNRLPFAVTAGERDLAAQVSGSRRRGCRG
ncbi:DUF1684 domain-containing protein [Streptomyces gamaensis]|uniref:DUF1684 domain-containing protein n=1 Tax=Streptomyces gamaensis TaxID=1763542 RepID=A0ABW0ZAF3_9ACTN